MAVAALPHGERVPVLRDLRGSSYLRQERAGLLIGPYEDAPVVKRAWRAADGPPDGWAWDLFQPDLERLEAFWRAAPSYAFVFRPGTRAVAGLGTGPTAAPPVAIALAFASKMSARAIPVDRLSAPASSAVSVMRVLMVSPGDYAFISSC